MAVDAMKKCSTCKEEKSVDLFYRKKKHKDGLSYSCKDCYNRKNYQWKKNNPDSVRETARKTRRKRGQPAAKKILRNNTQQQCTTCNQWKDFSYFYRHPTTRTGFQNICKACVSEYNKERLNRRKETNR